ncbi:Uncharacterized protein HZ326_10957 [Fusarium oxysporum f. sp. albedinis]|nr:Uncharacterized protein HZ326_10957 [Fusarium oxysporum f. sp. albedinis]
MVSLSCRQAFNSLFSLRSRWNAMARLQSWPEGCCHVVPIHPAAMHEKHANSPYSYMLLPRRFDLNPLRMPAYCPRKYHGENRG